MRRFVASIEEVMREYELPQVPVVEIGASCPYHGTERTITAISFLDKELTCGTVGLGGNAPAKSTHMLPTEFLYQEDRTGRAPYFIHRTGDEERVISPVAITRRPK